MYVSMYVCVCASVLRGMHICTYIFIWLFDGCTRTLHMYVFIYVCICIYVCMCSYMYVYAYMYVCVQYTLAVHVHTYICTSVNGHMMAVYALYMYNIIMCVC